MLKPIPPRSVSRYDWSQVRRYWESHALVRGTVDSEHDPDGLDLVCHTGAPRPVNRYYHRGQQMAFLSLLDTLPPPAQGATALDVGCGTARWSRLLSDRGYEVTGIDLQRGVIDEDVRRFPWIRFEVTAVQDFVADHSFDLVSTVTVLQHLPHEEQERAIGVIGGLLRRGGHAIVLENTSDWRSPTVFANTAQDWAAKFDSSGMSLVQSRPYDYSPALRSYYALTRSARARLRNDTSEALPDPESSHRAGTEQGEGWAQRADRFAKVLGSFIDSALDPTLFRTRLPLRTGHVAAIFRRR